MTAMAAVLAASAAAGTVTVPWPASGPLHVLFVGDSLTDGGAVTDWRSQFREQITEWLGARGQVVATKDGKGGVRVAYWSVRKMAAGQNLAIVELGTNDLYKMPAPAAADLATFERQYRTLIGHITAASPGVKLVCLSVWHPVGEQGSPAPYNALIQRACPGAYVNISDLGAKSHLAADGFHPNDVAHKAIAARIEHVVHLG